MKNMQRAHPSEIPSVIQGLKPAMRDALIRFVHDDPDVSALTLKALVKRGLVNQVGKKRWRWAGFAVRVRRRAGLEVKTDKKTAKRSNSNADRLPRALR